MPGESQDGHVDGRALLLRINVVGGDLDVREAGGDDVGLAKITRRVPKD